jgi:hypothetical protein
MPTNTEFDLFEFKSVSHPLIQTVVDGIVGMSMFAFFLVSLPFIDMLMYNFVALPFVLKLIVGQIYLAFAKTDDLSMDFKLSTNLFVTRSVIDAAFLFLFAALTINGQIPLAPYFVYVTFMIIEIIVSVINLHLLH